MPKKQLPLKILALTAFILFIVCIVHYKSVREDAITINHLPVITTSNTTPAIENDTAIKKAGDTIYPLTMALPSSKSGAIFIPEKPLFFPKIIKIKRIKDSVVYLPINAVQPSKDTTPSKVKK